jgi:hypothetical protein
MTAFAAVVGHAGGHLHHQPFAYRAIMTGAAVLAIVVGGFWLLS